MELKVVVCGLSPTTKHLAFTYPSEWEVWGLPWDEGNWLRYDRLFEMHDMRLLMSPDSKRKACYIERLKHEIDVPLYMQADYFDSATRYPFERSVTKYFNSSIAYMIALAISEKAKEIAVVGVDMKGDDEYGYQKPNIEYLIGLAEGKGIKVSIPDQSPLLKFNGSGINYYNAKPEYVGRYGWLG